MLIFGQKSGPRIYKKNWARADFLGRVLEFFGPGFWKHSGSVFGSGFVYGLTSFLDRFWLAFGKCFLNRLGQGSKCVFGIRFQIV